MSNSVTRFLGSKSLKVPTVVGTMIAASIATTTSLADSSQGLWATWSVVAATVQVTPTSDPTCPFQVMTEGAGVHDLLGSIHVKTSSCLQLDLTFDQGVATFTGAASGGPPGGTDSGDSITYQFRGRNVPTALSVLPTATTPAGGFWLDYHESCVWKGTGKFANVVNNCPVAPNPGRFYPQRGAFDFDRGQGNFFGVDAIRLSKPTEP